MRIRLEHNGNAFEFECRPMKKSTFRVLCGFVAAALYAGTVTAITAMCGLPGLAVTLIVTAIFGLMFFGMVM